MEYLVNNAIKVQSAVLYGALVPVRIYEVALIERVHEERDQPRHIRSPFSVTASVRACGERDGGGEGGDEERR